MATSRTGTTAWLKVRARLIRTRLHVCHWCNRPLDPKARPYSVDAIEVDHLIAVQLGGTDDDDNLVLACHPCNRRKSNKAAPGQPFDLHGRLILDPKIVCRVHGSFGNGLQSTCPHSDTLVRADDELRCSHTQ